MGRMVRMGRMGRMGVEDDPAHAGGPSSLVLNDALNSTRDGTVGYWDGGDRFTPRFPFSDPPDVILYLQEDIRGQLLNYALFSAVSVQGIAAAGSGTDVTLGAAEFHGTAGPVVTIHQPPQDHFPAQLRHLRTYADLRGDRIAEVNAQLGDGMSFLGAVGYLDGQRRGRTLDLLEAVERLTVLVEMQVKHMCRSPRPIDYAPEVQPMIQTVHACVRVGGLRPSNSKPKIGSQLRSTRPPSIPRACWKTPVRKSHRTQNAAASTTTRKTARRTRDPDPNQKRSHDARRERLIEQPLRDEVILPSRRSGTGSRARRAPAPPG